MRKTAAAAIVTAAVIVALSGILILEATQAQAVGVAASAPTLSSSDWSRFLQGRNGSSSTGWDRFLLPPSARPQAPKTPLFHASIVEGLAAMDLTPDDLASWVSELPETALRHLASWSEARQEKTAVIARFIRTQNGRIDAPTAWREAAAFVHYSRKYGVPADLAVAVANTESHFDPQARSNYGALGVMQVVWRIHHRLLQVNGIIASDDLHDPEIGIAAGCLLLGRYLRAYGDTDRALGRYYGGSAKVYMRRINTRLANLKNYAASIAATL